MTSDAQASGARPRPAWVPDSLYPFESHYADVAGCVVHYVDEGGGPPLLLLHGNPTWSFLYRDIVPGQVLDYVVEQTTELRGGRVVRQVNVLDPDA